MFDTSSFIEESKKILNTITDTVSGYANAGKNKLDLMALESELSKAQKQLGALVYSLYKTEQDDSELTKQYIDAIDDINEKIERAMAAAEPVTKYTRHCSSCGHQLAGSDMFCAKCGVRQG